MATKKKTDEPEVFPAADESNDVLESTKQPETSDVDLNELLGSMDGDTEDDDTDEPTGERDSDMSSIGRDGTEFTDGSGEGSENTEDPPAATEKPKRAVKKKKEPDSASGEAAPSGEDTTQTPSNDEAAAQPARRPTRKRTPAPPPVLTIESRAEVESQENIEETAWHEIRNAYRTRKILTGTLGGIEQTETGKTIAVVSYNDFRVVIPMKEMMINLVRSPSGPEYDDLMLRQNKILGNMLGAEIDFIVKGIESKTRSIVASRKDAMLKKRQLFYMNTDAAGMYRIYDGRIVQARVIAVADKVVRIEAFGVECSILARDLSWDWLGDAHERFNVGDQILVRVLSVKRNSLEDISIKADVKSVSDNTSYENLKKCRVQSKYAGKVTDVHKGVVYIRLANGANAIAHSCYDRRTPGKKDDVSFAVTHIDEERGVAVGLITRIIKQNL
jgi:hypothetical protein